MATVSIEAGQVLRTPDADIDRVDLTIDGEFIQSVGEPRPSNSQQMTKRIDADGLIVAPGFIDLQINGGFGIDLAGALAEDLDKGEPDKQREPDALWELGRLLPQFGVTSFLPTIISSPPAVTDAAIASFNARPADFAGAEPLGLHFEGPMLNRERAGAHRRDSLLPADRTVIRGWSKTAGVLLVTVAPELPGAIEIISELVANGVKVSAGHSSATAAQARAGVDAGISMITHLFNAMEPLSHRAPNLVGVGLTDSRLAVGVIVDGVHVDPTVIDIVWRAKGPTGTVLVTDAVSPMGQGPGVYDLGRATIIADDHRVATSSGTLAGSILTMDRAIRNLIDFTGCTVAEALTVASPTPAHVIGAGDRGRLEPAAVADVVLLDDQMEVQITICRGRPAYVAAGARDRMSPALLPADP